MQGGFSVKKGKTVLLVTGALALILVAGICSMGLLFQSTTDNAENLYSQIDNEKIAPITPQIGRASCRERVLVTV